MRFPFFKQQDAMDCGPTCLRMVAKHNGKILPDVKKIHAKYKDEVSVKIITVEETETIAKNYLKQMKVSFDVFFESLNTAINVSNFSLVQYLGFRFYPSFYLFDKRGNLVFTGRSNPT